MPFGTGLVARGIAVHGAVASAAPIPRAFNPTRPPVPLAEPGPARRVRRGSKKDSPRFVDEKSAESESDEAAPHPAATAVTGPPQSAAASVHAETTTAEGAAVENDPAAAPATATTIVTLLTGSPPSKGTLSKLQLVECSYE